MNKRIKRKKLYKEIELFMDKYKIVESCCKVTAIDGNCHFNISINGMIFDFKTLKDAEIQILKI